METGLSGKGAGPSGQLNLRGICPSVVMAAFRDMEEVSQGLLSLLGANRAEAQQRRLLRRHEQVVERLLETQDGAEQRLRGEGRVGGGERGAAGSRARVAVVVTRPASNLLPSGRPIRYPISSCDWRMSIVPSEPRFPHP